MDEASPLPRLLLIDDEPLIAALIQRSLRHSWHSTCTSSATGALELLKSQSFDVVICDLMMPGMSGMEFAGKLEELNPSLRARTLFLTGGALDSEAEVFLARPDVCHMTKPLRMSELETTLQALAAPAV